MCTGEMAAANAPAVSAEVYFAQKLASNEKPIRDKALKKLRKWFEAKSIAGQDLTESDFIKLWKGLHYCLWMQDKPLLQEELSDKISNLVHAFKSETLALRFVAVFFKTEAREWDVLDKWRVDKYMMLVRLVLRQSLTYLKKLDWKQDMLLLFRDMISAEVMSWKDDTIPDGLRIHVADIYLDELEKIGAEQLSSEQVLIFLEPFSSFLPKAQKQHVLKRIIHSVFRRILTQAVDDAMEAAQRQLDKEDSDDEDEEIDDIEDLPDRLQFDFEAIADRLFELGGRKDCIVRNRPFIYNLVQKFKDLQEGVLKKEKVVAPGVNSRKRLQREKKREKGKFEVIVLPYEKSDGKKKKDRKRKSSQEKENSVVENSCSPKKKKKSEQTITAKIEKANSKNSLKNKNKNLKDSDKPSKKLKVKQKKSLEIVENDNEDSKDGDVTIKMNKKRKSKKSVQSDEVDSGISIATPTKLEKSNKQLKALKKKGSISSPKSEVKKRKTSNSNEVTDQSLSTGKKNSSELTSNNCAVEQEVDVWVPNKKYKGIYKEVFEKEMKKSLEEDDSVKNSPISVKDRKTKLGLDFAKFDKLVRTPPAFVRRSVAKLKTPKTDLKKKAQLESTAPGSAPARLKKKVVFDMAQNKAQDFKQSLKFPPSPFQPNRRPEQSILKLTPVRNEGKRRKSMSSVKKIKTTPVTRKRASDFF